MVTSARACGKTIGAARKDCADCAISDADGAAWPRPELSFFDFQKTSLDTPLLRTLLFASNPETGKPDTLRLSETFSRGSSLF